MSEQENRDTLERYRQEFFERQDIDAIADLMHDDYVEDYPEIILEYDGNRMNVCDIVELQDGKIKRSRAYFAEPFDFQQAGEFCELRL